MGKENVPFKTELSVIGKVWDVGSESLCKVLDWNHGCAWKSKLHRTLVNLLQEVIPQSFMLLVTACVGLECEQISLRKKMLTFLKMVGILCTVTLEVQNYNRHGSSVWKKNLNREKLLRILIALHFGAEKYFKKSFVVSSVDLDSSDVRRVAWLLYLFCDATESGGELLYYAFAYYLEYTGLTD